jgi:hypothetical protein
MNFPNFIILGETKCGTTSLYEDIVKHPNIIPAIGNKTTADYEGGTISLSQKEIRFFDRYWSWGLNWYKKCFPKLKENQITGEASPTYLYRKQALQRIFQTMPSSTKLIITLRNPIDRLYSHYHHVAKIASKWTERYPTFGYFIDSAYENDYYLIDKGFYVNSIKECFKLFPKEKILIIESEDFYNKETHEEVLNKIFGFLNISKHKVEGHSHLRKNNYSDPLLQSTRWELATLYWDHNTELQKLIGIGEKWNREEYKKRQSQTK